MMSATARTLTRANAFLQIVRLRPAICGYSSGQGQSKGGSTGNTGCIHQQQAIQAKKDTGKQPKNKAEEKVYKAPELYEYNPMSFYDIEVDMSKSRLQQPSSIKPKPS
ncbi:hypothetical protein BaRGS_00017341 [Batillaria attramentaria]|uniref:NADH dehydrogenase [ubiquinone] flavoprotein 3, mitochondrial n=1 Tax=Batillaria attramentaria TaxID=370345 RepID=A0ABD0KWP2_9CAEN